MAQPMRLLRLLDHFGAMTTKEIAKHLGTTIKTTRKILFHAQDFGLVFRDYEGRVHLDKPGADIVLRSNAKK